MSDLIQLTDVEIAAVAGGQSIDIDAHQSNTSTVTQTATATNSGAVSAGGGEGLAIGAASSNQTSVFQVNSIVASNSFRSGRHH